MLSKRQSGRTLVAAESHSPALATIEVLTPGPMVYGSRR